MSKRRTIKISCANCGERLYDYYKGGTGHLVKCFVERIKEDFTKGDLKCPGCEVEFARERMVRGKPAHKIVQGKVTWK
jgi:hypothetical protein